MIYQTESGTQFNSICGKGERHLPVFDADRKIKSFALEFTVSFEGLKAGIILASAENIFTLETRKASKSSQRDQLQNYFSYPDADGEVSVLESSLFLTSELHPEWNRLTIGMPFHCLPKDDTEHRLVLEFSDARWTMYLDGEKMDEDFPYGYPPVKGQIQVQVNSQFVSEASFVTRDAKGTESGSARPFRNYLQCYTPHGFNTWVGDVVTFSHDGRFYLFYLIDRRHHRSKFGKGGHEWALLSSSDLKNWDDHGIVLPIEHQWETMGTGTPFFFNGRYFMTYGYHSSRITPAEKTIASKMKDFYDKNGKTGVFTADDGKILCGMTYAESDDCINFKKSYKAIHFSENPSIYVSSGKLLLFAGGDTEGTGIWESDHLGGFSCLMGGFPPHGKDSFMRNCLDCPSLFEWHGTHYLLIGFTGFWSSSDDTFSNPRDLAREGHDLYDGMGVPMVSAFGDRRILAGWLAVSGWGGVLGMRELVWNDDGIPGMKWLAEAMPEKRDSKLLAEKGFRNGGFEVQNASFYLEMNVSPASGKMTVEFLGDNGKTCSFFLDMSAKRAQFSDGSSSGKILTNRELAELRQTNPDAQKEKGFSVENIRGLDSEFTLRFLINDEQKLNGTVADVEIAGNKTIMCYSEELHVRSIRVHSDGAVSNLKMSSF